MSYVINYSDTLKTPITISSGTNNDSTSVNLLGKNYIGYGPLLAENFLHVLENFANTTQPANPVEGQLWYDTTDTANKQLKVNIGAGNEWNIVGLSNKTTFTATTVSIVSGNTATIELVGYPTYVLSKVSTTAAARVRLYVDETSRTADTARLPLAAVAPGSGLVAEIITTSDYLTQLVTPAIVGFNNDSPTSSQIYLLVTNNAATAQAISVTLTLLNIGS